MQRKPSVPPRSRTAAPETDREPVRQRPRASEAPASGNGVRPWCKKCRARLASFVPTAKASKTPHSKRSAASKSPVSFPPAAEVRRAPPRGSR
jgi:hypothetical protein